MSLTRRELIKAASVAAGALATARLAPGMFAPEMPKRRLGKTGWEASLYGLGTAEIPASEEAIRAIHKLIDGGVNYLDTAPSYQGTRSETALGEVLKTRRKEVFLATKTLARDADGAYAEVKQSLQRLQSKQIDLLQIHAINDQRELDRVLAKGGAVEGLERAKKEGLIRHIGITGHTRPSVILSAIEKYPFATILIPLSALDKHLNDFGDEVVPRAQKLQIGIVGMKALKGIERARGEKFEAEPFLRYTWSLPVSTVVVGLRRESEVEANLRYAKAFKPMTAQEKAALEGQVRQDSDDGHLWWKRQ